MSYAHMRRTSTCASKKLLATNVVSFSYEHASEN